MDFVAEDVVAHQEALINAAGVVSTCVDAVAECEGAAGLWADHLGVVRLCAEDRVVFAAARCAAAAVIEEVAISLLDPRGQALILYLLLRPEGLLHKEEDLTEVALVA